MIHQGPFFYWVIFNGLGIHQLPFNTRSCLPVKRKGPAGSPSKRSVSVDQTAKEVPHPQVDDALGLLNTNPRASRPVPQSISIPCRYSA